MKHTVWHIPSAAPIPEELTQAGYPSLLSAVLAARGIRTAEEAAVFLDGQAQPLEDPFLLSDMDRAADRIRLAAERKETVAVYGDYDVDGITSACLLTEYLRGLGLTTEIYIPDRLEEGYGLNTGAIDRLKERGVSLIITVDCGVTAVEETDYAASVGIETIITDHHECQATLPRAVAVVNPKRPDSSFTGRDLAGVGVAFKLACALDTDAEAILERFADLVAVGTVADVMPLTGENRHIVKAGLDKLSRNPRPGLAALMAEAGLHDRRLNAGSIGYSLAPRINAAGRLGLVQEAAELMLETDPSRTASLAAELCEMNRERQRLEAEIWAQAEEMLAGTKPNRPIVLAREGWHQGVIGIVASRLTEAYSVPVVMISLDGDRGKGSSRSFGGFNLFDALSACGSLLEAFGGHALAAGLNIRRENVDAFRDALGAYYAAHPPCEEDGLSPEILIDDGDMLKMNSVASLDLLEPCGVGNPRPSFCITGALLSSVTPIGGGKHVSLRIERFGQSLACVWFGQQADTLGISPGAYVDLVFFPQVSEFRGRSSVQLVIQAMRRSDLSDLCRSILTGGRCDSARLNRNELAHLWRALERCCPLETELSALGGLTPRLTAVKAALGLRVLSELSLAQLEFELEGSGMTVRLQEHPDKAELMDSPTWRANHY